MLSSTVEIRLMPPLGGPDARPYRAATRELRSNQLPYAAEQAMSCAAAMTQKATDQRSRDLSDREEVRRLVHFGANALDQGRGRVGGSVHGYPLGLSSTYRVTPLLRRHGF